MMRTQQRKKKPDPRSPPFFSDDLHDGSDISPGSALAWKLNQSTEEALKSCVFLFLFTSLSFIIHIFSFYTETYIKLSLEAHYFTNAALLSVIAIGNINERESTREVPPLRQGGSMNTTKGVSASGHEYLTVMMCQCLAWKHQR